MALLWRRSFDTEGVPPVIGAQLYTYEPTTSTPKPAFTDAGLSIPHANPILTDGAGRWPAIYLSPGDYRLVCRNPDNSERWTTDPEITEEVTDTTAPAAPAAAKNVLAGGEFWNVATGPNNYADGVRFVEEWYALAEAGDVRVSRQSNQEQGQPVNLSLLQPDVSAKRIGAITWAPTRRTRHLRGQAVVMSARIRASSGFRVRFAILGWAGTADAPPADPVNNWSSGVYGPGDFFTGGGLSVVASGSLLLTPFVWASAPAITGSAAAGMNNLGVVFWTDLGIPQNATLDLGLVQLEAGGAATAFERLSAVDIGAATGALDFLLIRAGVT